MRIFCLCRNMKAEYFSETLVRTYKIIWRYILDKTFGRNMYIAKPKHRWKVSCLLVHVSVMK